MRHALKNMTKILPMTAVIFFVAAAGFSAEEKKEAPAVTASKAFKLSGYTQLLYTAQDAGIDGFSVRRVRFILSGEILKNIRYKIQVDALKSPILLEANIDFSLSPNAYFRIGQFKVPFSQENLASSSDLDTVNRSQSEEKMCPGRDIGSQGRDIGATFTGSVSIFDITVGVFNGAGINKADTNEKKDLAGRFLVRPASFLTIGASLYDGQYSATAGAAAMKRDRTGLEIALLYDVFSVKGEFISAKDGEVSRDGWYLQAGYFVLPKKLQGIFKVDSYDKDKNSAGDRSNLWTAGLNWFLSEKIKLQVNFELYKDESGKTTNKALLAQFQAGF